MKELLLQYTQYNIWANKQIIDAMVKQGEETAFREATSSFPTLQATMLHVWSAESIWLQRMEQVEKQVWHMNSFTGTFAEGCREWEQASAALVTFIQEQTDTSLQDIISFRYRNANEGRLKKCDILQHVCNHSTYHRGQFVTMLRQLGATEIPGTDLALYLASKY